MKWYKRDPDAARLDWLRRKYGSGCCGEYPRPAHVPHFVYLIGANADAIKIGICRDLMPRLRTLQTASAWPLDLFWSALVPSREIALEIEAAVLSRFRRLQGEWVSARPSEIIEFLEV